MASDQTGAGVSLAVRGVSAGYGATTVLREIDLDVAAGSIVALIGANGAGKTTLLRTVIGLLPLKTGDISVGGTSVASYHPYQRVEAGLCLIPEGRGIFPALNVRDNLLLQIPPWERDRTIDLALDAIPVLKSRLGQLAGSLSGGEQQMLALARCYLSAPRVVLVDEVSMGLAPRIVEEIFQMLEQLARTGIALVLVEQYINRALEMAARVYLLDRGQITFSGAPDELDEDLIVEQYLGIDREQHEVTRLGPGVS